ncbi:MAG TPA: hypothetical protein VI027_04955 [Rubrobacteraceae bacterium]
MPRRLTIDILAGGCVRSVVDYVRKERILRDEAGRGRKGLPLACNLPKPDLAKRRRELAENIFGGALRADELEDGYEFAFPGNAEWVGKLVDFVSSERICCPFFAFELIFEPDLGPIWLRVRGAKGVKEFIERVYGAPDQINLTIPECVSSSG